MGSSQLAAAREEAAAATRAAEGARRRADEYGRQARERRRELEALRRDVKEADALRAAREGDAPRRTPPPASPADRGRAGRTHRASPSPSASPSHSGPPSAREAAPQRRSAPEQGAHLSAAGRQPLSALGLATARAAAVPPAELPRRSRQLGSPAADRSLVAHSGGEAHGGAVVSDLLAQCNAFVDNIVSDHRRMRSKLQSCRTRLEASGLQHAAS